MKKAIALLAALVVLLVPMVGFPQEATPEDYPGFRAILETQHVGDTLPGHLATTYANGIYNIYVNNVFFVAVKIVNGQINTIYHTPQQGANLNFYVNNWATVAGCFSSVDVPLVDAFDLAVAEDRIQIEE